MMNYKTLSILLLIVFGVNFVSAQEARMSEKEFGDYIFRILVDAYKEKSFRKSDEYLIILNDEAQLGLESLYKKYEEIRYGK